MDRSSAADSLAEIRRRETQTIDTATRAAWPWWNIAGIAILMIALGAALDHDEAIYLVLCVLGWLGLTALLAGRGGVRLHRSVVGRTAGLTGALAAGVLVTYTAARAVLQLLLDAPWPSTLAMTVAALLFVALSPLLQRAYRARLTGGRR